MAIHRYRVCDPDGECIDTILTHSAWHAADLHRQERQRRASEQGECLMHELTFVPGLSEELAVILVINGYSYTVVEEEETGALELTTRHEVRDRGQIAVLDLTPEAPFDLDLGW